MSDKWFYGLLALAILSILGNIQQMINPEEARRAQSEREAARHDFDKTLLAITACEKSKKAVLASLRAPSTADFPSCGWLGLGEYQIRTDGKSFSVSGYVDAQNAFGAKLRNRFVVLLDKKNTGDESTGWSVRDIAIAP